MTQSTHSHLHIHGTVYDGRSITGKPATLQILEGQCVIQGEGFEWQGLVKCVNWGEPNQFGTRIVTLPQGEQFSPVDSHQLTQYLSNHGLNTQWVARITMRWRWALASLVGIVAATAALYLWGMPMIAKLIAPHVPPTIQASLGQQTLEWLESSGTFTPSTLSSQQQAQIQQQWQTVLSKAYPDTAHPAAQHVLLFRRMKNIPNAMAIPGGTIVLTDELVTLLHDQPDALMGVIAHELGHVSHHHSMQMLIGATGLGLLQTVLFGDATGIMAQIPFALGLTAYSRNHEAQADDEAIRIMRAADLSPAKMALFFERVRTYKANAKQGKGSDQSQAKPIPNPDTPSTEQTPAQQDNNELEEAAHELFKQLPDVFDSHPADEARIRKFKQAS